MTAQRKARILGIGAVAALALAAAAPATAGSDQAAYSADYPVEYIYDNDVTGGVQDYVAFVGWTAADACVDPLIDGQPATMTVKPDGPSADRYTDTTRVYAEVYEYTGGGVFDFFDDYCSAALPEPLATGDGVLRVRGTSTYEPGFTVGPDNWYVDAFGGPDPSKLDRTEQNWFRGSLRTADGDSVQVAMYAAISTFYGPPDAVSIDVWGGR